jgi:peptide chain release factor 1
MLDKLEAIKDRYIYLQEQLSDPEVVGDMSRFKKISKEFKDLSVIVTALEQYKTLLSNQENAKQLAIEDDEEMREMARGELAVLNPQIEKLESEIRLLLIPKDPEDIKDVVFEIRAGTGGDEAAIFAGDLYRMYSRYFERKGWRTETQSVTEGTISGYSKVIIEVYGEDVYGTLKYESGAHRVQRVPETEAQGRVHTSAATVVVLPILEMEDVNINKADLKIDTFRSSGAGGQHVNKTESGVRVTHIPTGTVAESQDERSQIKNREIAYQRLYQKIYEAQRAAHELEVSTRRKSLVGSGDRSDKIRTYNYPQNRVTDHRINLTLYRLTEVMNGDIDELIEALQLAENAERLQEGSEVNV